MNLITLAYILRIGGLEIYMANVLRGNNGELINRRILFAPPQHDAVVRMSNVTEDIIIEDAYVIDGGDFVLVKGYLNRSVEYLTTNKEELKKLMKKDDEHDHKKDDKENGETDQENNDKEQNKKHNKEVVCERINPEPRTMAIDGVIRHTTVWIPFEILVNVQNSRAGDNVVIESITLECSSKGNRVQEIMEEDLIRGIVPNDIVNVHVRVEQQCH